MAVSSPAYVWYHRPGKSIIAEGNIYTPPPTGGVVNTSGVDNGASLLMIGVGCNQFECSKVIFYTVSEVHWSTEASVIHS